MGNLDTSIPMHVVFLTFKITLRNILNLKLHCTAVPNIIGIM